MLRRQGFPSAKLTTLMSTKHFYAIQLAFGALLMLIMATAPRQDKIPRAYALI